MVKQARLMEMALRAEKSGRIVYTRFLDPQEAQWATAAKGVRVAFEGGWPDAERRMAAFCPVDSPEPPDWPIAYVRMRWPARYGTVGHRDILGALMGLQIDREQLGDILVQEGEAYAVAIREMASHIAGQLTAAGRVSLTCDVIPDRPGAAISLPGQEMHATVSSLRLDAVLAAAFHLARGDAQTLVTEGRVRVDHLPEIRPDRLLAEGSLISIRGMGRARIEGTGAINRKGRLGITLMRFG